MASSTAIIGAGTVVQPSAIIEAGAVVGADCYIDHHAVVKAHVCLGNGSFVGCGAVLGEYTIDFFSGFTPAKHPLNIGEKAVIRSGSILYGDSEIGSHFNTGHNATVREHVTIGNHVSIGTLSDIQNNCRIGNFVRIHSRVFMASATVEDCVWIFPGCTFTDDPTPPSSCLQGVTVEKFGVVGAGSVLLPGVCIGSQAMVAAGSVVTKDVPPGMLVLGNPAKVRGPASEVKSKNGEKAYPWQPRFSRGMPWDGSCYDDWLQETDAETNCY